MPILCCCRPSIPTGCRPVPNKAENRSQQSAVKLAVWSVQRMQLFRRYLQRCARSDRTVSFSLSHTHTHHTHTTDAQGLTSTYLHALSCLVTPGSLLQVWVQLGLWVYSKLSVVHTAALGLKCPPKNPQVDPQVALLSSPSIPVYPHVPPCIIRVLRA